MGELRRTIKSLLYTGITMGLILGVIFRDKGPIVLSCMIVLLLFAVEKFEAALAKVGDSSIKDINVKK